jgi:hypothetical protein
MKKKLTLAAAFIFLLLTSYTNAQENNKMTPAEVYQAFGKSMMEGTKDWYNLLHNDIEFRGPVDQSKGKQDFIKLNESFLPTIRGNKLVKTIEDGNYLITQVEMQVFTETEKVITLYMTEWYEVVDGKFKTIKVYYDSYEFRNEGGMKKY